MNCKNKDEELVELRRMIDRLALAENGDYQALADDLRRVRHKFHAFIARVVEQPINNHLQSLDQHSIVEKREVAKWLNNELRSLGLAIRSPGTGEPGHLRATSSSGEFGRFQVALTGEKRRSAKSSDTLFHLELMPFPDRFRHSGQQSWQARASRPRKTNQKSPNR